MDQSTSLEQSTILLESIPEEKNNNIIEQIQEITSKQKQITEVLHELTKNDTLHTTDIIGLNTVFAELTSNSRINTKHILSLDTEVANLKGEIKIQAREIQFLKKSLIGLSVGVIFVSFISRYNKISNFL